MQARKAASGRGKIARQQPPGNSQKVIYAKSPCSRSQCSLVRTSHESPATIASSCRHGRYAESGQHTCSDGAILLHSLGHLRLRGHRRDQQHGPLRVLDTRALRSSAELVLGLDARQQEIGRGPGPGRRRDLAGRVAVVGAVAPQAQLYAARLLLPNDVRGRRRRANGCRVLWCALSSQVSKDGSLFE